MPTNKRMKVRLNIDADGKIAVAELERVRKKMGDLPPAATKASQGMDLMSGSMTRLVGVIGGAASLGAFVRLSKEMATASDTLQMMQTQMDRMAGTQGGFGAVVDLSDALGASMRDTVQAVNYFAPTFQKLGKSFSDSLGFVKDLNKSLRLYGVSGAQAASVTLQLSQGLDNLQGDELKSLREGAAGLYTALEKSVQQVLGTKAALKDLGSQGRLTGDVMTRAFDAVFSGIRKDFESLPDTLAQQEARMANAWTRMLDAMDDSLKASDFWKWFTGGMAASMDSIAVSMGNLAVPTNALIGQLTAVQRELNSAQDSPGWLQSLMPDGRLTDLEQQKSQILAEIARRDSANAAGGVVETVTGIDQKSLAKLKGVNNKLAIAVRSMIADAAKEGIVIGVSSGLRSPERNAAVGGSPTSRHLTGGAADLTIGSDKATAAAWIQANAGRYGISFPVGNESPGNFTDHLHAQLAETAKGATATGRAMTGLTAKQKAYNTAVAEAARIYQSTRTPLEDYIAKTARLVELNAQDLISVETKNRAIAQYQAELDTATNKVTALTEAEQQAKAFNDQLATSAARAFGSLAANFGSADDVLKRLLFTLRDLIIEFTVIRPLAEAFAGALNGTGASASGGGLLGKLAGGLFGGLFGGGAGASTVASGVASGVLPQLNLFAAGGAVGATGLAHGVYTTPAAFPLRNPGVHRFASGAGILGEAGPEFIMPAQRGPDGKLGVSAHGVMPQINVNVNNLPGQDARVTADGNGGLTIDIIRQALAGDAVRGGADWTSGLETAYGIARGGA